MAKFFSPPLQKNLGFVICSEINLSEQDIKDSVTDSSEADEDTPEKDQDPGFNTTDDDENSSI